MFSNFGNSKIQKTQIFCHFKKNCHFKKIHQKKPIKTIELEG